MFPQPPNEYSSDPYHTESFPPGTDGPDFVPFADPRKASKAQGNCWPIDVGLRDRLVMGERDGRYERGTRLSYMEILDKYTEWKMKGNITPTVLWHREFLRKEGCSPPGHPRSDR